MPRLRHSLGKHGEASISLVLSFMNEHRDAIVERASRILHARDVIGQLPGQATDRARARLLDTAVGACAVAIADVVLYARAMGGPQRRGPKPRVRE